jgi:alpha-L-fucosidase 2
MRKSRLGSDTMRLSVPSPHPNVGRVSAFLALGFANACVAPASPGLRPVEPRAGAEPFQCGAETAGGGASQAPPNPMRLSYDAPAKSWEREALPIGNGRLGAMLLGAPDAQQVQFNESSLWTGDDNPSGEYDDHGFGAYQAFGNLYLELTGVGTVSGYSRSLDLATAVHETVFTGADGTRYEQRAIASHPSEVIAIQLRAAGPSRLSGSLRLEGEHGERVGGAASGATEPPSLSFAGRLPNGLEYAARALVLSDGTLAAEKGDRVSFSGATELTVLLSAATNYALDARASFRGPSAEPRLAEYLSCARSKSFEALRAEHVADYRSLFGRVELSLGETAEATRARSMAERVSTYTPGADPELVERLFQYGRYLLIASSRDNGLPANLQGLWNEVNTPPWHSDYHTNINVQMNYWLAEPANLAECHEPLFRLLTETVPACRAATRAAFGKDVPGFTYRTSHNIFGGQGWEWNPPASAWYALHYYEHWAFGRDLEFLREQAYPYLREVSEFWLHRLKALPDGTLVAPRGWSPEHGPWEDGVRYEQELVWELFTSTLEAAAALGVADELVTRVKSARDKLYPPKVGRWGQLQEWIEDRDDPADHHRHTSHLIGVFPGRHISVTETPEWAKAAEVSLRARGDTGDSRRSWTWPWRAALWARLGQTDGHRMIDGLIAHNLLPNLITTHPPLQLDGNFGITAAIAEMLMQSHAGEISLLPGVDRAVWPNGAFRGLRARGGFEVSARWADGDLVSAEIIARSGGPVSLRSKRAVRAVSGPNGAVTVARSARGTFQFETQTGEHYRVDFE